MRVVAGFFCFRLGRIPGHAIGEMPGQQEERLGGCAGGDLLAHRQRSDERIGTRSVPFRKQTIGAEIVPEVEHAQRRPGGAVADHCPAAVRAMGPNVHPQLPRLPNP